jgi:hypothetical protein
MENHDSIPGRGEIYLSCSQRSDRPCGQPSGYTGWHLRGDKAASCEADQSPSSSAAVKNAWSYASTPPYDLLTWHCTYRDNLTFTFYLCVCLMFYSLASPSSSVTDVTSVQDALMYASLHSDARLYTPTSDACSSLQRWTVRSSHYHVRKIMVKSYLGLTNVKLWTRMGECRYSSWH